MSVLASKSKKVSVLAMMKKMRNNMMKMSRKVVEARKFIDCDDIPQKEVLPQNYGILRKEDMPQNSGIPRKSFRLLALSSE